MREPKTLAGSASVADVRRLLAKPKVPDDADPEEAAFLFAAPDPETLSHGAS